MRDRLVAGRNRPRHRRPSRPFLRALGATLAIAVAATVIVGGLGTTGRSGKARAAEVVQINSAHGASYVPALEGQRPLFILALGSDARPGQRVAGQRADSIHLIGVDLKRNRGTILGFPRDSWVPIPGHGTSKINTAMVLGGPQLMVRTVESITGIRIDFWILTSFRGLIRMVNDIGGLRVYVPRPMHDRASGANFSKGTHRFSGKEALAFARDRHDVPGGDIGRSANHGKLLLAALSKLNKVFDDNPGKLFDWVRAGWKGVTTNLSLTTLLDLALTATSVPPKRVKNVVVPGSTGSAGGASVVFISSSAQRIFADMRQDGVVG